MFSHVQLHGDVKHFFQPTRLVEEAFVWLNDGNKSRERQNRGKGQPRKQVMPQDQVSMVLEQATTESKLIKCHHTEKQRRRVVKYARHNGINLSTVLDASRFVVNCSLMSGSSTDNTHGSHKQHTQVTAVNFSRILVLRRMFRYHSQEKRSIWKSPPPQYMNLFFTLWP